ncbi:hypothetical protein D1007_60485 [Hordeum vulgare]|nr:hypothetical protein D1007_60485 [Hordeum vulgare]
MDDDLDLDAAADLASLASSGKGKPRAPRKSATSKTKKVLTPEQREKESAKRKDRRNATDTRHEAIAAAAAQPQVTNARITVATREGLCMLRLNHSQHGLVNATVAAAVSTGSSFFLERCCPTRPARRLATQCLASTSTRRPPASWGVLARGEHGRAFHACARAHRPQCHTSGRWLVSRRREETRAADASRPAAGHAQPV